MPIAAAGLGGAEGEIFIDPLVGQFVKNSTFMLPKLEFAYASGALDAAAESTSSIARGGMGARVASTEVAEMTSAVHQSGEATSGINNRPTESRNVVEQLTPSQKQDLLVDGRVSLQVVGPERSRLESSLSIAFERADKIIANGGREGFAHVTRDSKGVTQVLIEDGDNIGTLATRQPGQSTFEYSNLTSPGSKLPPLTGIIR